MTRTSEGTQSAVRILRDVPVESASPLLEALERLSAQCDRLRLDGQRMTGAEEFAREVIARATKVPS